MNFFKRPDRRAFLIIACIFKEDSFIGESIESSFATLRIGLLRDFKGTFNKPEKFSLFLLALFIETQHSLGEESQQVMDYIRGFGFAREQLFGESEEFLPVACIEIAVVELLTVGLQFRTLLWGSDRVDVTDGERFYINRENSQSSTG